MADTEEQEMVTVIVLRDLVNPAHAPVFASETPQEITVDCWEEFGPDAKGEDSPFALADGEEAPVDPQADEPFPGGNITRILEWVGDDENRAAYALEKEIEEGNNQRPTLVEALREILNDDDDDDDDEDDNED